jgi:hypothetical protein
MLHAMLIFSNTLPNWLSLRGPLGKYDRKFDFESHNAWKNMKTIESWVKITSEFTS